MMDESQGCMPLYSQQNYEKVSLFLNLITRLLFFEISLFFPHRFKKINYKLTSCNMFCFFKMELDPSTPFHFYFGYLVQFEAIVFWELLRATINFWDYL